ncbi:MAG: hypothetical protein GY853_01780 [PVC group bacterium]|nr:hypothetical protein [PVC group bacterium]
MLETESQKTSEELQREKRKKRWKERKKKIDAGEDPKDLKTFERAQKAVELLRMDFAAGKEILEEYEREALTAVVVKKCTDDFYYFCKYILGNDLMMREPHRRWCDDHQKTVLANTKRVMRLKPRKTFKTTIYGLGFLLWAWGCVSHEIRFFYTSSNKLLLDEVADGLSQYIGTEKNETFYSYLFGVTKDPEAKNTSDVMNVQGREGKGFSLILRTSGGSTVGIHPNVIIIDDPVGEDDRKYESERKSKELWFDTLQPLLVSFYDVKTGIEFESIFYIGTRWHLRDLVWHIQEELVKKKGQVWDIESESITKDGTPTGEPSYPDFMPAEKIKEFRISMSEEFFAAQELNNPIAQGMIVFDLGKLHFIRQEQFDAIKLYGKIICAFDPALGKASGDYPAVWFIHYYNDTITFFDAIDKKIEIALLVHQIASKNKLYGCRTLVYEDNNAMLIGQSLEKAHKRINHKIVLDPVHHGSGSNKRERIVSCQDVLYSGVAQFMNDYENRYPEAMNQVAFYGAYGHDDFPDAMEMGISYLNQEHFKFVRHEECL